MAKVTLHTGPGVFEVLAHVCRSPSEALKQFVENSADAIEQAKTEEGQIRIKLTYQPVLNGLGGGLDEAKSQRTLLRAHLSAPFRL